MPGSSDETQQRNSGPPKSPWPRKSRARGLRTSTGCLTCRKRRVKCDEGRPRCGQCSKSDRSCSYAQPSSLPSESVPAATSVTQSLQSVDTNEHSSEPPQVAEPSASSTVLRDPNEALLHVPQPTTEAPDVTFEILNHATDISIQSTTEHDLSPLARALTPWSPSAAPFDWFDLLAQDAINSFQKSNFATSGISWRLDETSLFRRQSLAPHTPREPSSLQHLSDADHDNGEQREPHIISQAEPWNTASRIKLHGEETAYFQHYVSVVGPILDLFDPERHFSNFVPHLALRNVGLLKSLLAVATRHLSLGEPHSQTDTTHHINSTENRASSVPSSRQTAESKYSQAATQYYYETLQYLSQTLLYPSYTGSSEILATATMISIYEMFGDSGSSSSNSNSNNNGTSSGGDWERHLRGAFWIQRAQDNDGESTDGLRRAVWWIWLRQDIWAAFREGRRTLTIWRPQRRLADLRSHELATRILYIAAKCIEFAATGAELDFAKRFEHGNRLLDVLESWRRVLPPSYYPILTVQGTEAMGSPGTAREGGEGVENAGNAVFSPIWIHPQSHAAAVQTYHFARIVVLLNQPSMGGLIEYRNRQKMLNESVETICGIAMADQRSELPSAFVNFQALYAAGLCVQTPEKQNAVLRLLEETLNTSRFPPKTLLTDLVAIWSEGR